MVRGDGIREGGEWGNDSKLCFGKAVSKFVKAPNNGTKLNMNELVKI